MKMSTENFVKETGLNETDLNEIRETFKVKYAYKKGWNPSKLTVEQLNEIQNQVEWKNPMLLS